MVIQSPRDGGTLNRVFQPPLGTVGGHRPEQLESIGSICDSANSSIPDGELHLPFRCASLFDERRDHLGEVVEIVLPAPETVIGGNLPRPVRVLRAFALIADVARRLVVVHSDDCRGT